MTDTSILYIFETALGRPVELLVRHPEGITHGSAVQPFGAVYASVIYSVEEQIVGVSLHRYVDAEDYYGPNNA